MKEYIKDKLIVSWEPKKCLHSEKCWRSLSAVFKPKEKPWIQLDGAKNDEIIAQINQCPSGALGFYYIDQSQKEIDMEKTKPTKIEIAPNGPILIKGQIEIKNADGSIELKSKNTALCRCGASSNKPYCDGSHKKVDFQG